MRRLTLTDLLKATQSTQQIRVILAAALNPDKHPTQAVEAACFHTALAQKFPPV